MPNLRTDAAALATIAGSALLGGVITFGSMQFLESPHHERESVWMVSHDEGPRIEIHSGGVSRAVIIGDLPRAEIHALNHRKRSERRERRRHRHRHSNETRHFDFESITIRDQLQRAANGAMRLEVSESMLRMDRQRERAERLQARMERQRERMERRRRQ